MSGYHRAGRMADMSMFEIAIRFTRWAQDRGRPLLARDWLEVSRYWEISRVTAYRWIQRFNDAMGQL